ncbi:MAG: hypothetical protein IT558_03690 [Alphaproteobacteria bacterium]|nr:hypothetical protein [Alphaproteobacteria bacterium]
MGLKNFNQESEKPQFLVKPNPLVPHSWQIFTLKKGKGDYEPVGEYTLIDTSEPTDITEKKMINLSSILNGKKRLIDFTNLTDKRILFNIITDAPEADHEKVVFRTYDGKGVSKENAVLTVEKGVLDE